jgi:hypothetical protein
MPLELFKSLQQFLISTEQNRILNYVNYIREFGLTLTRFGTPTHFKDFVSETLNEVFDRKIKPIISDDDLKSGKTTEGGSSGHYPFGQLSTKEEAAGKIRVFAMVDY